MNNDPERKLFVVKKRSGDTRILWVALGFFVLISGIFIYYLKSSACPKFFSEWLNISCIGGLPEPLSAYIGLIPDVAHPFALILLGAAALNISRKNEIFLLCLFWFLIEVFFEFLQHPAIKKYELISNYYSGVFDVFDIVAYLIGTLLGYIILVTTIRKIGGSDEKLVK